MLPNQLKRSPLTGLISPLLSSKRFLIKQSLVSFLPLIVPQNKLCRPSQISRFHNSIMISKQNNPHFEANEVETIDRFLFLKIMLVGVVGTGVFVAAVKALDKKPQTSYSEKEYNQVISGLRRKTIMFPGNEYEISFVVTNDDKFNNIEKKLKKAENYNFNYVIDPYKIVEQSRKDSTSKYQALLQDYYESAQSGEKKSTQLDYYLTLPTGMVSKLLGEYIKENCDTGTKIAIVLPTLTIENANKFESDITSINSILIPRDMECNLNSEKDKKLLDLIGYYRLVNKVQLLNY